MINLKSAQKKINDTLSVNEYLFFKKKYHKSVGRIDTGINENKIELSLLNQRYPFLHKYTLKHFKSMSSVDLERVLLKDVCSYLNSILKNKQSKKGKTITYRVAREQMEKDFESIIFYLLFSQNSKKKEKLEFKEYFISEYEYKKTISLLKSNQIITNDNNELQNNSATKMAILICKLIELNFLKNTHRKKKDLAESMMKYFSFQFDSSYFSKIIKDYNEYGSFEYDHQHQNYFNSLNFLDVFQA